MGLNIKQCPYCGDYFGAKLIAKHMGLCSKKNKVKEFICPDCRKSFSNEQDWKKHMEVHKLEGVAS